MAAGKAVDLNAPAGKIEAAISSGNFTKARLNMAVKLGRMMDATDCARDAKSICLSLIDLLDKCEADELRKPGNNENALAQILREAEETLANA